MTLRYRMNVAHMLLADWERATDAVASHPGQTMPEFRAALADVGVRFDMLTEWLTLADLNGSSFDPTTPLYMPTDYVGIA